MSKTSDAKKALAKTKSTSIVELIGKNLEKLGQTLPSHMNPERIGRIAMTTLRQTPKLMKCDPNSFMGALFQSAALGLEPNIEGQAYIIPYGNNAQFQIGYKGYIELFYRHQAALSLDMQEVKEGDDFDYAYGTDSFIKHKPAMKDRGEVICYYAVAKMKDGASIFKVMSKEDCIKHGKQHSKTFNNGPWKTDPDAMCKKTVLIQLMKLVPKSIEIQKALAMDETIKTNIDVNMEAVPDETDYDNAEPVQAEVEKDGNPKEEKPKEPKKTGLFPNIKETEAYNVFLKSGRCFDPNNEDSTAEEWNGLLKELFPTKKEEDLGDKEFDKIIKWIGLEEEKKED